MIFTECVNCDEPFTVPIDEMYVAWMPARYQLVSKHICAKCGAVNYVEHRRFDGETFGADDPRAKALQPVEDH